MVDETKKRVKTAELIPQIKEIEDITKTLKVIVDNLPDSSVKDAYEYSVENLEAKNEKFLSTGIKLTDEQKKAIALIRKGSFDVSKILISETGENSNIHTPIKKTGKKTL